MDSNSAREDEVVEVSPQILSAYNKGRAAAKEGITECPYQDKMNSLGRPTFSRSYRIAWIRGWMDEKEDKPQRFVKWPKLSIDNFKIR